MSYGSGYDIEPEGSGPVGFWSGLHPGVRSAVIMWGVLLAIALLNSFTGGTSLLFCYPVQVLLYIANGYMAGKFALDSGYPTSDLTRVGSIAGVVAWIMPALYYIVGGLILGVVTLGLGLVALVAACLFGPVDLAIHAACGALGGWLYGRGHGDSFNAYEE